MFIEPIKKVLGREFRRVQNFLDTPAVILLYHRVISIKDDRQLLAVEPVAFSEQMEFLSKNFKVATIEEFKGFLKSQQRIPPKTVVITFDDGYWDNYHQALPILEKFGLQGLFYISTANIGSIKNFWWDRLEQSFWSNVSQLQELEISTGNQIYRYDISTTQSKHRTYQLLNLLVKKQKVQERENILKQLTNCTGENNERGFYRIMNREEIRQLSLSKSAVIGAHTHNHVQLSAFSYEDQYDEIKQSKDILEEIIGQRVKHFSYPFGGRMDFNRQSQEIVYKLGFEMACSAIYGQVHSWSKIYRIPRVLVRNWDLETFKRKINQYFSY